MTFLPVDKDYKKIKPNTMFAKTGENMNKTQMARVTNNIEIATNLRSLTNKLIDMVKDKRINEDELDLEILSLIEVTKELEDQVVPQDYVESNSLRATLCCNCSSWEIAPNCEQGTCTINGPDEEHQATTNYDTRCLYGLASRVWVPEPHDYPRQEAEVLR